MDTSSTGKYVKIHKCGIYTLWKDGDRYSVKTGKRFGPWRTIDRQIEFAMEWIEYIVFTDDLKDIGWFIKEYVGEARWVLATLANM